jgi:tRNA-2-methylthio-N6-dimethylallyladenosine synthase
MPQLHMPLQSGSDQVLKAMRRSYRAERFLGILERARAAMPDLAVSTDVIVGFPGETEEDFQQSIDMVERLRFDNAFVFRYSQRHNTPAAELPGQLSEADKEHRNQRLLETVNRIAIAKNAALVGTTQQVLCEGPSKTNAARLTGRSPHNKIVIFDGDAADLSGKLVDIQIRESGGFSLFGEKTQD